MSDLKVRKGNKAQAKYWAEWFVETKKTQNWSLSDIDEGLMITWFANAMMAMYDTRPELIEDIIVEVGELIHYADSVTKILIENGYPGKAEALKDRYMKVYKLLDIKL